MILFSIYISVLSNRAGKEEPDNFDISSVCTGLLFFKNCFKVAKFWKILLFSTLKYRSHYFLPYFDQFLQILKTKSGSFAQFLVMCLDDSGILHHLAGMV